MDGIIIGLQGKRHTEGGKDILEYVFTKAPNDYDWDYNWIAREAAEGGNKDIVEYVFAKASKDYTWDYNDISREAERGGNKDIVDLIQRWKDKNN